MNANSFDKIIDRISTRCTLKSNISDDEKVALAKVLVRDQVLRSKENQRQMMLKRDLLHFTHKQGCAIKIQGVFKSKKLINSL